MKLDLYTQKGEKKGTVDVNDVMFKAPVKEELMRLALMRQMAHARQGNAHTKQRGEVSGGGRKPWRQKGTGRARFGSSRNPVWRSGGIAFGPRNDRNYTKLMNKKERRAALFSGLSLKAESNQIFALDTYASKEPKTKEFQAMMEKLPAKGTTLIVIPESDMMVEKSAGNLPNVKVIVANYLNLHDILKYENIMFLEPALKKAEELFL